MEAKHEWHYSTRCVCQPVKDKITKENWLNTDWKKLLIPITSPSKIAIKQPKTFMWLFPAYKPIIKYLLAALIEIVLFWCFNTTLFKVFHFVFWMRVVLNSQKQEYNSKKINII